MGEVMNHKELTVCKSNKVVEACYRLTLNEQRVILACIAQVNSTMELLKTDRFELTAKDFAKLFNFSEDRSYSELQAVAKQLFHRYVIIENPKPENPKIKYTQTHWISGIDYVPDDGKIILRFAQDILPYLSKLRGEFTKYKLEYIGKMTSIYAIRLYELLAQWQSTGTREIELQWLKKRFQIEDKYEAIKDLKLKVLDPAVKDINEHSNFTVSWAQRKTGRRVTHLIFTFAEKKPAISPPPASAEVDQLPPIIAELLQLVPEQERGIKTVLNAITKHEKSHGAEYVRRNILYSNIKAEGSYRGFLIKALAQDWGHDWEIQARNRRKAVDEKEKRGAELKAKQAEKQEAEAKAKQEESKRLIKAFSAFEALPKQQQTKLKNEFFNIADSITKQRAKLKQDKNEDIFSTPFVKYPFIDFLITQKGF